MNGAREDKWKSNDTVHGLRLFKRPFYTSDQLNKNLLFGIRPVMEAVQAGKEIEKIYIQQDISHALINELKQLLKKRNLIYQHVPVEKLNRLTQKNHQGAVCFLSEITYHRTEDIVPAIFEKGEVPLLVILDRITDVRNFGAIARVAECAGVHAIIIPLRGAAQVNGDAMKAAAGALNRIPVCREENLKWVMQFLKDSGIEVVACTEKTDDGIYEADLRGPVAFIMGSEEDGVSGEYMKRADRKLKIPMMGEIASLNVSVATGIVLYETLRQRKAKSGAGSGIHND